MQASDILGYDLLKVCNEGELFMLPVHCPAASGEEGFAAPRDR